MLYSALFVMRVPARKWPDRIPLFSGELGLVPNRQLLHPAVIDIGYRLHTLGTHPPVADDLVILWNIVIRQHHRTCNDRIVRVAVVVRIIVQHNQPVGELAGDIGIVSSALLSAKVHAMAARIAGNAPYDFIARIWIVIVLRSSDDGNRSRTCCTKSLKSR